VYLEYAGKHNYNEVTGGCPSLRLKYEGFFEVPKGRIEVYQFLVDPRKFARALPGFKNVEVTGEGEFKVDLTINIGPLRGDATVTARFVEAREHSHAKVTGRGRGAGSTLDFTLTFTIDEINTGSKINWVFEGTVGGLAASIGGRVLDSIARNIINDVVNNLKNQLLNL
jgi:carbon monoxide dehydrogenase subunit G